MTDSPIPVAPERHHLFESALSLAASKTAEDEHALGVLFPYVTDDTGAWRTLPASMSAGYVGENWSHGNWFCGFWVGLLAAAHVHTGRLEFLDLARERMTLVAPRAGDPNTHDIGFIFTGSAIPLYRLTGEETFARIAQRAADRLRARLIATRNGAYISSWGPLDDPRGRKSSAIDTMTNLPLLYWAADYSGDSSFRLVGQAHADKTAEAFIRPDGWTYHAVEYDAETGDRLRGYTFQGYADESRWSRGQAWAIYGFSATAAATGRADYLEIAGRLADTYLASLDASRVPYWDADDPAIPNAPRDSSSAAIVASALFDMAALEGNAARRNAWSDHGLAMLETLCRDYLATEAGHRGLLKHSCYSKPHGEGVDSATLFGDFFLVEALCKVLHPGSLFGMPTSLTELA